MRVVDTAPSQLKITINNINLTGCHDRVLDNWIDECLK